MTEKFDLIIIGGGPAGYAAAMRAVDYGKKVCLIEKNKIGGAGIYDGALASKALWEVANKVANINNNIADRGNDPIELSWEEVTQTVNEATFDRKFQYSSHIKLLQLELQNRKLVFERGFGKLLNANEVEITFDNSQTKVIFGEFILLSTGSKPRTLPNIIPDEKIILTSNGIHHIEDYPKSLVIVGAGVIGCEYATIFANFGKTKVYLIDRAERILPFEDEDISELVDSNLQKKGVTIHHNATLKRLEVINNKIEYELSYPDGSLEIINVEKALLSVGREPRVKDIGLNNVGIKLGKTQTYIGDYDTQTNIPNIFTAGDASGRLALVNIGELEARHAVERMFGSPTKKISYDNISTIMFLDPEVATVGMSEQQCIKDNVPVKVVKVLFETNARAIAMRKTQGFFKIIVSHDKSMKILGMRAIGEHASSAIQALALLIKMNKGIHDLTDLVYPHPSFIEGIQECVRLLLGQSIFKPTAFKDKMKCYGLVNGKRIPLQKL